MIASTLTTKLPKLANNFNSFLFFLAFELNIGLTFLVSISLRQTTIKQALPFSSKIKIPKYVSSYRKRYGYGYMSTKTPKKQVPYHFGAVAVKELVGAPSRISDSQCGTTNKLPKVRPTLFRSRFF